LKKNEVNMVSLVSALRESAVRVRDLLSAPNRPPIELVFYMSCRIQHVHGKRFRATILVRCQNIAQAESTAESHLHELLKEHCLAEDGTLAIRWLKARPLSSRPREDESETTLRLLSKLRRHQNDVVSTLEPLEAA
jgi:hypothetical protein